MLTCAFPQNLTTSVIEPIRNLFSDSRKIEGPEHGRSDGSPARLVLIPMHLSETTTGQLDIGISPVDGCYIKFPP